MNSLLKMSAGILLCLPLTGCVGPGYYDPSTGMVCQGEMYGPTNFIDDIKCSLSEHRAQRMCKHSCNTCNSCDPCGSGGFGASLPGMLSSGTFSYGSQEGPADSYLPQTYAPQSSCPHCGPQGATFMPESNMHESVMPEGYAPETYDPGTYTPETYTPGTVMPESGSTSPTTVIPQKITPVPNHGHKGVIEKPAPAPAAEEPKTNTSYVPPALLRTPTMMPNSASPHQGARPVQWVPAQIH